MTEHKTEEEICNEEYVKYHQEHLEKFEHKKMTDPSDVFPDFGKFSEAYDRKKERIIDAVLSLDEYFRENPKSTIEIYIRHSDRCEKHYTKQKLKIGKADPMVTGFAISTVTEAIKDILRSIEKEKK